MAKNSRSSADYYTQRARKEGYPARSVYKLEEILEKTPVIKRGQKVLDIGAAPGSWTLYLSRKFKAQITAVDLKPLALKPLPGVTVFTGDAFSEETADRLADMAPFDAVISDAAPATTGNRTVDTVRSYELVLNVIKSCSTYLKPGGALIVKVFQGGEEKELLEMIRVRFENAKALKPKACRKDSFEVFFIASGYRKPE